MGLQEQAPRFAKNITNSKSLLEVFARRKNSGCLLARKKSMFYGFFQKPFSKRLLGTLGSSVQFCIALRCVILKDLKIDQTNFPKLTL